MKKKWHKVFISLLLLFLYFPIFYLMFFSFNSTNSMSTWTGFSFDFYTLLMENEQLLTVLLNSILIAVITAMVSAILGTVGAIAIYFAKRRRMRELMKFINSIMIVSPDVVIGISFLLLFTALGLELGFFTVTIAHIAFCAPFAVITILPKLEELDGNIIKASKDLGASDRQTLFKVIIPNIAPGIIAAFALSFLYSIDDFAVTYFVTGNGFATLPIEIYSIARRGISLELNALSTIIFLVTIGGAYIYYHVSKRGAKR